MAALGKQAFRIELLASNKSAAALNRFKKDIGGVNNVVSQLGQTLAAAFSVRELVEAANVMIGVKNRMDAFTGSAEETAAAMNHMKRIALDSRSDFDAVAMLFTRLSLATEHLGATQKDVADATQMVANTFIIAGSHAQEANNSARQLAQGLASGALRGDELRSVMENNTILTKMLADGLNMTVGELREFGHAGGLTAEKVMPMTLGQAGVALRNNFQFMIGDIQESTQGFSKLASGINFVAQNLDALLIPAIGGVTLAIKAMSKAIIANPFGLLLTAFSTLIMAAYVFRQEIYNDFREVFDVTIPNFIDKGLIAFETLKQGIKELTGFAVIKSLAKGLNLILGLFNSAIDKMPKVAERLGIDKIKLIDTDAIGGDINESVEKIAEARKRIRDRVVGDTDYEVPSLMDFIFGKPEDQQGEQGTGFTQLTALEQFLMDAEKGYKDFFTNIKTMQEEMQGVFKKSYDGVTQLTMDFLEKGKASFKDYATSVVRELIRIAVQKLIIDRMFGSMGQSFKDIKGVMEYNKLTDNDTLFDSFSGGGYTGMGARAGGVDGKGGFPAILHPNETVIDHTKGQGMQSAPTVNFNISTVDAAGFDQLLASRKGLITSIINNAMNNQGKMGVV
jgi:tape measure domain-containing protein